MTGMITVSEARQDWFFTFGFDHAHPNGYVLINGTYEGARREMIWRYLQEWSSQYNGPEITRIAAKYGLVEYPLAPIDPANVEWLAAE